MEANQDTYSTLLDDLTEALARISVSKEKRNAAMEAVEVVVGNAGVLPLSGLLDYLNGPLAETLLLRGQRGEEWKFDPAWHLALEMWDNIGRRQADHSMVAELVSWVERIDLGGDEKELSHLHHLANRFAWATRGTGGFPDGTLNASNIGELLTLYVYSERRRFMFKFAELGDFLRSHHLEEDPALEASLALSEIMCGQETRAVDRLENALDKVRTVKRYLEIPTTDIALHAMWLADGVEGQADYILEWAGPSRPTETTIMCFRRAKAYRLKGNFEEAMREIQKVFDRIDGNTEFSRTFSEQAIREREIIQAVQLFDRSQKLLEASVKTVKADAVGEVKKVYEDSEARIADLDRNSLIRSVEVVTLFTAAVSFAIGGISLASGEGLTSQDRLRLLVGLGTGLLTFAFFIFAAFEFARTSQVFGAQGGESSLETSSRAKGIFRNLAPLGLVFLALVLVNVLAVVWLS